MLNINLKQDDVKDIITKEEKSVNEAIIKNLIVESKKTALELVNQGDETMPMLVDGFLPKVGLTALIGSSDGGKSSLLRQLGLAIVSGNDFLNWKTHGERKKVWYLSTEDNHIAIAALLKKQMKDIQCDEESLNNLVFFCDTEEFFNNLQQNIEQERPDLIMIDAFADVFTGELYETNKVRSFLNLFQNIAVRNELCILFLHHVGKRTEDLSPSKNNALGSQGFEAKMRLVVELKTDKSQPQKKYFCIVKGNYLPYETKRNAYNLLFSENLVFKNTNETTPFENINRAGADLSEKERKYNDIMQMKDEGKTWREISDSIGMSESGIRNFVSRYEKLLSKSKLLNVQSVRKI